MTAADDDRQVLGQSQLDAVQRRVVHPVDPGPVGLSAKSRWPGGGRGEVVDDEDPADGQHRIGIDGLRVGRVVDLLSRRGAAVEHQQVERAP